MSDGNTFDRADMNASNWLNWCRSFFTRRAEMFSLFLALMKVSIHSAMVGCGPLTMMGFGVSPRSSCSWSSTALSSATAHVRVLAAWRCCLPVREYRVYAGEKWRREWDSNPRYPFE